MRRTTKPFLIALALAHAFGPHAVLAQTPEPVPAPAAGEAPPPEEQPPLVDYAVTPPPAATPPAQHALVTPESAAFAKRAERLELWLSQLSATGRGDRINAASWSFAAATIWGVTGVSSLFADDDGDDTRGSNAARVIAGGVTLGLSAGYLYAAIANIGFISPEEDRLRRWESLHELDEQTVLRFEAELAAAAMDMHRRRMIGAGTSVGVAAAGGTLLLLTPTLALHDGARTALYIAGGGALAIGAWQLISALTSESDTERAYRAYRAGKVPEVASTGVTVAPQFYARGAGLGFSGSF